MTPQHARNPADPLAPFNLGDCEREPIHAPGCIQPHGCLVVCGLPKWIVTAASANLEGFFGRAAADLLGRPLETLLPRRLVHDLRNVLQASMVSGVAERLNDVAIGEDAAAFDLTIHMVGSIVIIECLPRLVAEGSITEPIALVKNMLGRLVRAPSFERFLQLASHQIRAVTGFDRVMVYKFLADDSGQVVGEALRSGMTPLIGLRYPASDIPAQARALYRRQTLRLIPDIDYTPVPLLTAEGLAEPIDLGLASLRSVSPVHIEYLRNMGSRATLTISILQDGRLWGLFACHHEAPRRLATATLTAAELFGQIFALQIAEREQAQDAGRASGTRLALDRLIEGMSPKQTVFDDLARFAAPLQELIGADGIAVASERQVTVSGVVPPPEAMPAILQLLGRQSGSAPFATASLGAVLPEARAYAAAASGLLAIPFRVTPPAFLMLFRREIEQIVTWGGNPHKPVALSPDGSRIGPRKSFETWRETVRGRSLAWQPGEIRIAEALRVALLEVMLRRADRLASEQRAEQENQALVIAELNHRVKNILALIRSLVRQSRQGARGMDDFALDLEQRVRALAMAHDQLTQTGWKQAPLRRLLEAEAKAWTEAPDRVVLAGPPVSLGARAYQTLALVFHEMMTNAAKYGALSETQGRLSINWILQDEGDLTLEWRERGGPVVVPPQRRGFGSIIMEDAIPFELGGKARIDYHEAGLEGRFRVPAAHIWASAIEAAAEAPPAPASVLDATVRRLLLLEDSIMIALDAQAMLREEGFSVDVAGTVADAARLLAGSAFDAGVLDINIGGDTSFAIADACMARDLPFVFATGYGESLVTPDRFKSVPTVAKPYDAVALKAALGRALQRRGEASAEGQGAPPQTEERP